MFILVLQKDDIAIQRAALEKERDEVTHTFFISFYYFYYCFVYYFYFSVSSQIGFSIDPSVRMESHFLRNKNNNRFLISSAERDAALRACERKRNQ